MKKIHPFIFLMIGIATIALSHLCLNFGILAWVASVPFLVYLAKTRGFNSRLWFVLAMMAAWSLAVAKIMTDPLPWYLIFAWSVPIALLQAPGYILWAKFRNARGAQFIFPATMVAVSWAQHTFTPLASWGAWGYTQVDNLILMQGSSLFGIATLGFLIHWINAVTAELWLNGKMVKSHIVPPVLAIVAVLIYGEGRYDFYGMKSKETMKVATVGTDSEVSGLPLPTINEREHERNTLFQRTAQASKLGAELVVWNEASLVVLPSEEEELIFRISELAEQSHTTIVAAYIVLLSESPFRYENKYQIITRDGEQAYTYNKHHPVPGEPAQPGVEPYAAIDVDGVLVSGAICYDYDFPAVARGIAKKSADVVALPASDWRGIDPIHTKMAAIRAIEQGHSVVRSTRFGLSAAINPMGELIAQQSSFDENNKILISDIPLHKVKTLYSNVGDVLVFGCILYLIFTILWVKRTSSETN